MEHILGNEQKTENKKELKFVRVVSEAFQMAIQKFKDQDI